MEYNVSTTLELDAVVEVVAEEAEVDLLLLNKVVVVIGIM